MMGDPQVFPTATPDPIPIAELMDTAGPIHGWPVQPEVRSAVEEIIRGHHCLSCKHGDLLQTIEWTIRTLQHRTDVTMPDVEYELAWRIRTGAPWYAACPLCLAANDVECHVVCPLRPVRHDAIQLGLTLYVDPPEPETEDDLS